MPKGDITYISDSMLLDKIFYIESGINKQAGTASDFLGSISGLVQNFGKEHIDTSSTESTLSSMANILVPGVLFKIYPPLGIIETVAQLLGFNPYNVIKSIFKYIGSKIKGGQQLTLEDVSSAGKEIVGQIAGPMESSAFAPLYDIEKTGKIYQHARIKTADMLPTIPFFGDKKAGVLGSVFGDLLKAKSKNKALWLAGGLIIWLIKTLLLGAGLLAVGGAVTSVLGLGKKTTAPTTTSSTSTTAHQESASTPQETAGFKAHSLVPSGRGQEVHKNDHQSSTWVVPLINNSIESTLLAWATDIYNQLEGHENEISSLNSFNKTVDELRGNSQPYKTIVVPKQFKTRKQIVDTFATEAASKIEGQK